MIKIFNPLNNLILIIFSIFFVFGTFFNVYAETISNIKEQIKNTNSQIETLDKEIKQYQDQINKTSTQSNSLSKVIKELTLTRDKLVKEQQQTEKKIKSTSLVIDQIDDNLGLQQKSINDSKKYLVKMLNELYRQDEVSFLQKILAEDSLSDVSKEYNNIIAINENIRTYINDLNAKQIELSETKKTKENENKNLSDLKITLNLKEKVVLSTKTEKANLLTETKNQEAAYQKLLKDRQKQRDAFEKELSDYENQLKFILNPKLLPAEGSGVLSWPLDNILITQLFGVTSASKRLYKSGSHSGVDFRAAVGTSVYAMTSGVVIGTGDTDIYCKGASFGKWVFIKYNNGLSSTYGHLSVISTKVGQTVKAGDLVALSGNTGHTTGPHLHVTVYASDGVKVDSVPSISCNGKTFIMPIAAASSYLDPMLYLPSATATMIKK